MALPGFNTVSVGTSRKMAAPGARVADSVSAMVLSKFESVKAIDHGRWMARCPAHADSRPSLSISELRDGRVLLHCFAGCCAEDIVAAIGLTMAALFPTELRSLSRIVPIQSPQPPASPPARLSAMGLAIWGACQPLDGDAKAYLLARHTELPPVGSDLRYAPSMQHSPEYRGPALVGLVTNAITGEPQSLHFTWICPDGRKADVTPPRRYLKDHHKKGGVVRIWPDDAVTHGLAIAEGIETALTLAHVYKPVWACLDAGNLGGFPVLDGIESLLIVADHDKAGMSAADQCADRWLRAGREVRVVVPPVPGDDLNDIVQVAK